MSEHFPMPGFVLILLTSILVFFEDELIELEFGPLVAVGVVVFVFSILLLALVCQPRSEYKVSFQVRSF